MCNVFVKILSFSEWILKMNIPVPNEHNSYLMLTFFLTVHMFFFIEEYKFTETPGRGCYLSQYTDAVDILNNR